MWKSLMPPLKSREAVCALTSFHHLGDSFSWMEVCPIGKAIGRKFSKPTEKGGISYERRGLGESPLRGCRQEKGGGLQPAVCPLHSRC